MKPQSYGTRGQEKWPQVPKDSEEASQGEKGGRMQWVLGGSIALVIACFSAVYAHSAFFTPHQ